MFIVEFATSVIKLEKIDYDIKQLSKIINASEEEIKRNPNWYLVNGKWHYFKGIDKLEKFINEILGSYICKKNNLPAVDYKVAKVTNGRFTTYGVMSENFRLQNKTYTTTFGLNLPIFEHGISNITNVREYFKNETDYYNFIVSILKAVAIDFYMNQIDRVDENLMFIKDENKIELAPLFDFSLSMDIGRKSVSQEYNEVTKLVQYSYKKNPQITDSKYYGSAFLEMMFPSEELRKLFSDYPEFYETFKNLIDFDMQGFLKYVEINYPLALPKALKTHYLGYHEEKSELIKKLI